MRQIDASISRARQTHAQKIFQKKVKIVVSCSTWIRVEANDSPALQERWGIDYPHP